MTLYSSSLDYLALDISQLFLVSQRPTLDSFFFNFVFIRATPTHMEVPRLGVESELQLPTYTTAIATWDPSHVCNMCHSSQQRWILNPLS